MFNKLRCQTKNILIISLSKRNHISTPYYQGSKRHADLAILQALTPQTLQRILSYSTV